MGKPVLFRVTNNLKIGGVQRRLRALLPLLIDDYEVHIVTYKDTGIFFDELAAAGVHTHFLPRSGHWNPVAIWKLAQLFRQHNAQIVHTHSFGGNIFGILAATLASVPVRIGQVHLCDLHWYGSSPWRRYKQMLEEKLIHHLCSDRILFVSKEAQLYFAEKTKLPASKLTVLHNGIAIPAHVPASRAEFNLPANKTLIGFVGRLVPGKGVETVLNLTKRLADEHCDMFHVAIIGSGSAATRLQQDAIALGITEHVSFLGERADIHRCYPLFDLLLFTSEAGVEGMPGVVLEACAHGLPILARKTRPLDEIHAYYDRIRFLDESQSIADQVAATIALPPADLTRFQNEFTLEAMKQRTLAIYASLLSSKQVSR